MEQKIEENEKRVEKKPKQPSFNQRIGNGLLCQRALVQLLANGVFFLTFLLPLLRNSEYEPTKSTPEITMETLYHFRLSILGFTALILNVIGVMHLCSKSRLIQLESLVFFAATMLTAILNFIYTARIISYNDRMAAEKKLKGDLSGTGSDLLMGMLLMFQVFAVALPVFEIGCEFAILKKAKVIKFNLN